MSEWKIEYDNDTGGDDGGFWEWWTVSDGVKSFKCDSEEDAKMLLATLQSNAQAKASEWQPISTAPKDGSPIILGRPEIDDSCSFSGQGRWHEEDHDGPDNMGHDAGFLDDEFQFFRCARSFGNPEYQGAGTQPTHWMPLPLPPKSTCESA